MTRHTLGLSEDLHAYLLQTSLREPDTLTRLRDETARMANPDLQVAPEQGQLLHLLAELTGARAILEIGTFTGYSAAWMALALPADGRLVACDVSADYTRIARKVWEELGLNERIQLHLQPALQTLDALLAAGEEARYDMAFIDADKENYDGYYERCLKLLRPGGLICVDNTLWHGRVIEADARDADTEAIRAFNAKLRDDDRVSLSMLPIGDGLTLCRKR
ncbi:O-methyltransferase [Rhodovibrio salinarum]|uniref:SAM-dependent methyltransferase n=1 Tax=Rhodovibrio salinarum TaxID=1087 RepID=A0A934QEF6_9PROT|nr:class I SAM-dependent methyltransferase [Rhodovibrio salinarum]MBK1695782.1 SAM-dependent methyltransferase [Rhodovibrio salinarum]